MLVLAETKQASEIIYWSAWVCKLDNEEELSKQAKSVSGQKAEMWEKSKQQKFLPRFDKN